MKIALLNNLFAPYSRGGAETLLDQMITDYLQENQELVLITTRPRDKKLINLLKEADTNSKIKTYWLPSYYYTLGQIPKWQRVFWHITNIFSFKNAKQIENILRQEKPDLVITHNLMGLGFLAPRTIRKLGLRHEHYLHDIQLLHPSGLMFFNQENIIDHLAARVYQLFTRLLFASPAKVISPSLWLLDKHGERGFFRNSETEIKNLNGNLPPLEELGLNVSTKNHPAQNFLFVGQVEHHKGIFLLLDAFSRAQAENQDLNLTIVGTGSSLEEAKKIASQLKNVIFTGRLEKPAVTKLMAENDYLIVPSLCYENAPLTIMEAHAAKLPVIASRLGGIPEITSPQDKLFVPGNAADLLQKILTS